MGGETWGVVGLAVARESVDHAEVVSHENRGELFEEVYVPLRVCKVACVP